MEVGQRKKFKQVLKQRGNEFEIFVKEKQDLDPLDGEIIPIYASDDEDKKKIPIGYRQLFEWISGYINDVKVQKRWFKREGGKRLEYEVDIYFESGDKEVIVRFSFDSAVGRGFAQTFRNIKLKKQITLFPWQMKAEPGQKYGRMGMSISYGKSYEKDEKIQAYYTKEYCEENDLYFERKSRDGVKFDKEAYADWLYGKFIEDVHYEFGHYEDADQEDRDDRHDDRRDSRDDRDDRGGSRNSRDDRDSKDKGRDDRGKDDRSSSRDNRDDRDDRGGSRNSRDDRGGSRDSRDDRSSSRDSRNDRDDRGGSRDDRGSSRDSRDSRDEPDTRGGRDSKDSRDSRDSQYSRQYETRDTPSDRDSRYNRREEEEDPPFKDNEDLPF